jgi:hypothetical protein
MVVPTDEDLNAREASNARLNAVLEDKSAARKAKAKAELEKSYEEYLARGGEITVCEAGARTEDIPTGQWTRNRSRVKPPSPVE